jgi:hypothetical protein
MRQRRTKCRETAGPLGSEDGKTVTKTVDMANFINKTFHGVFTREDDNIPETEPRRSKTTTNSAGSWRGR